MAERLIVAGLATWRLCSLLLYEPGPFSIFVHVRSWAAGHGSIAPLFGCIYCLSVWVAAVCAVFMLSDLWWILLPFALSAMAVLVELCSKRLSKSLTQG
jgi:hypothetical protein